MQYSRIGTLALLMAAAAGIHAQPGTSGPGRTSAQPGTSGPGIYTCTDARGRTLTADRPIPDCADREQRELSPSGSLRRKIEPTYSMREQAEREERQRKAQLQASRALEERRRERALVVRYPNAAAHDRERAEALVQIDAVITAARKRLGELTDERRKLDEQLEFYAKDASKAPDSLRRRIDDNAKSVAVQNRFIADQDDEKKRVNARFDEEQNRLRPLWSGTAPAATSQ